MLEVSVAQRVVQRPAGGLSVFGGTADYVHHGYVLGIATRDRIGGREFTHPECRY